MTENESIILQSIDSISSVEGVNMDANALAEDIYLLTQAFDDEGEFQKAISETVRSLTQIVNGEITASKLKYSFENFNSYHYQHSRAQGNKADMRVVYTEDEQGVFVLGFGHRNCPTDIYERLAFNRIPAK